MVQASTSPDPVAGGDHASVTGVPVASSAMTISPAVSAPVVSPIVSAPVQVMQPVVPPPQPVVPPPQPVVAPQPVVSLIPVTTATAVVHVPQTVDTGAGSQQSQRLVPINIGALKFEFGEMVDNTVRTD